MRNIWTIAKREFSAYFISPMAYAIAFFFMLLVGIFFVLTIVSQGQNPYGGAPNMGFVTSVMVFLLIFAIPALTMRLLADEVRMGTMELLLTAPLRDYELVVGKWLGSFLFILSMIGITLIYPFILNLLTKPGIDQMLMVSSYLGLILVAAAFLSLGVGVSAIFSNQIAAFIITLFVCVFLWWFAGMPGSVLTVGGDVFRYVNMGAHFYEGFNQGTINLSALTYYISLIALGLVVGTTAVETRRWR